MYYLKLSFRKLFANKLTTIALLFSLCVGFISYIIISSYVVYEKSYDRHVLDYENIYRIVTEVYSNDKLEIEIPQCERILGQTMVEKFSTVIASGYLCHTNNSQYKFNEDLFSNENVFHASSELVDVLSVEIIQSKNSKVLNEPYKVIISEGIAKKYFGNENPIGEILFKYPGYEYEIEGVFKDLPNNMHFKADMFLSFHDNMRLPPPLKDNWGETSFYTYLRIDDYAILDNLEKEMNIIVWENKKSTFEKTNVINKYKLQALQDIYLKSNLKGELSKNGRNDYLNILIVISFLVLIASGFNYVYFSYTRVLKNVKDIGIQKVFGISKKNIIKQFLIESILIHAMAMVISFLACSLIANLIFAKLSIDIRLTMNNLMFWVGFGLVYILSSILTIIFPVLMVSQRKPLELLSFKLTGINKFSFRQIITIVQFVIIVTIISVIIGIDKQINFLINKDVGLDISNSIVVKTPQYIRKTSRRVNKPDVFEQELLKHPGIISISSCSSAPGDLLAFNFNAMEKGTSNSVKPALYITDSSFFELFNVKLIAGENFLEKYKDSKYSCIVNRTFVEKLGYRNPEDLLGRVLNLKDQSGMQNHDVPVCGVCCDFNFESMKEKPVPIVILNWTHDMLWGNYIVKLDGRHDFHAINSFISNKFNETFLNYPYEYYWLENHYNKQYREDYKLTLILKLFVLLTILISVINLFSMVRYSTMLRTKEIGIRKVNGASALEIIKMLSIDFLKWIVFASIIAIPISYYSLNHWLEVFAYKSIMSWWIFTISGVFALLLGLVTISWQTYRIAIMNPANALRYE